MNQPSFHLDHVVYPRLLDTPVQYKSHLNYITVIMLMSYECWVFSWSLLLLINILNRKPSKFKFPMASPSPKIDRPQIDTFFKFWAYTKCVNLWRRTVCLTRPPPNGRYRIIDLDNHFEVDDWTDFWLHERIRRTDDKHFHLMDGVGRVGGLTEWSWVMSHDSWRTIH